MIAIFHSWFISLLAQQTIKSLVSQQLGHSVQYESAYLDGTQLVLIHPSLENKDYCFAEKMTLQCQLSLKARELNISIQIDKPYWQINPDDVKEMLSSVLDKREAGWLKIKPSISIKEGLIKWMPKQQNAPPFYFALEFDSLKGGFINAQFDAATLEKNCFNLRAFTESGAMIFELDFHHLDCASLFSIIQPLLPMPENWKVTGTINGEVKTIFSSKKKPYMEGNLTLNAFSFAHDPSKMTGYFHEINLFLEKNPNQKDDQESSTLSHLNILQPGTLSCVQDDDMSWMCDQLSGSIYLNGCQKAFISLAADAVRGEQTSRLNLKGNVQFNAQKGLEVDMTSTCLSQNEEIGELSLKFYPKLQNQQRRFEINCKGLSYYEWKFLQALCYPVYPALKNLQFEKGVLDALLEVEITQKGFEEVSCSRIHATNLQMSVIPWSVTLEIPSLKGKGTIDLSQDSIWSTLDTDIYIKDGKMSLPDSLFKEDPLTEIETHLNIHKGVIDRSIVNMQWAGLRGQAIIEWQPKNERMTLQLEGGLSGLVKLLPASFSQKLDRSFDREQLLVSATLKSHQNYSQLLGTAQFKQENVESNDRLYFGCQFYDASTFTSVLEQSKGWFYIDKISLDRFISPLLFPTKKLLLQGEGEFQGLFDLHSVGLTYRLKNPKIESENFTIGLIQNENFETELAGYHHLDLDSYQHEGELPFQHGFYLDKMSGVLLSELQSTILFQNGLLQLPNTEGFCHGIYFAGDVRVDYSNPLPGILSIDISLPSFSGKISHLQNLFSKLDYSSFLYDLPLEGEVENGAKGISMALKVFPSHHELQAQVEGFVINGALTSSVYPLALKDLHAYFTYQHATQDLYFKDILGTVLVGKPQSVEEYLLDGSYLKISHFGDPKIRIDASIKDHTHYQYARLVAEAEKNINEEGIEVQVNPLLSHIGNIHPSLCSILLKEGEIERFNLESTFQLTACMTGLSRFQKTGFLGVSSDVFKKIGSWKMEGNKFVLSAFYKQQEGALKYTLKGEPFSVKDYSFQSFLLQGQKQNQKWEIEQLQVDDLSISAEIQSKEEDWRINFLGLRYGKSLLVGLQGIWQDSLQMLDAKINLLKFEFEHSHEWAELHSLTANWFPKGTLQGEGHLKIYLKPDEQEYSVESIIQSSLNHFSLNQCPFYIDKPLSITYQSEKGLVIQGFEATLTSQDVLSPSIKVDHIGFTSDGSFSIQDIEVKVPYNQLIEMSSHLHTYFPEMVTSSFKDLLSRLKGEGDLAVHLEIEKKDGEYAMGCDFPACIYPFRKKDYVLQDVHLSIHSQHLYFSAFSKEEQHPFQLKGKACWPSLDQGECILVDETDQSPFPLRLKWKKGVDQLFIQSVKGAFAGLKVDLEATTPFFPLTPTNLLQGSVLVEVDQALKLADSRLVQKIQEWNAGPAYLLNGVWWIETAKEASLLDSVHFQGTIKGDDTYIKGYQIESLEAKLSCHPGSLELEEIVLNDPAFSLESSQAVLVKDSQDHTWSFVFPSLTIKNLRPGQLREKEPGKAIKNKSLLIKRIEIEDLYGQLNSKETWKGKGHLQFLNPARKNLPHPLLTIPAELISRLGLDPQVLNPVSGTIYFDLQDERFYLTKFKDVYSEGRSSKFHLAQNGHFSWMDMDGNLSVQIRMKQYNLLFKLAELFTVSVQGHLKRPTYSLQKHIKATSDASHSSSN